MNIDNTIIEIEKFSKAILSVGSTIEDYKITDFETKYSITLPNDYKTFARKCNGLELFGTKIYGIKENDNKYSLHESYVFEHYEVENAMPLYLVPFSPDGGGN